MPKNALMVTHNHALQSSNGCTKYLVWFISASEILAIFVFQHMTIGCLFFVLDMYGLGLHTAKLSTYG